MKIDFKYDKTTKMLTGRMKWKDGYELVSAVGFKIDKVTDEHIEDGKAEIERAIKDKMVEELGNEDSRRTTG